MQEATLLFLEKGDHILLAMKKRGYGVGKWNGIGGKVEAGESVAEALVRECQEEIGVIPIKPKKLGTLLITNDQQNSMHVHIFTCDHWRGQPRETEEMRPEWFSRHDIPYDSMWPTDRYWLPCVLGSERFMARLTLDTACSLRGGWLKLLGQDTLWPETGLQLAYGRIDV